MARDARTLYDSPEVHAALQPDGRVRVRRGGPAGQTVCNVSAERIVEALARPADGDPSAAWLALRGAVARVDFARHEGDAGLVGPFLAEHAEALAHALRVALELPRSPLKVSASSLREEPERWHERLVEADGEWTLGEGVSDFAGAWLYPPPDFAGAVNTGAGPGTRRVRVVGFFRCTGSRDFEDRRDGHGPHGLAAAEIDGFAIEPV